MRRSKLSFKWIKREKEKKMLFLSKMAKPLMFAQIALALTVPAFAGVKSYNKAAFEACASQVGDQRGEGVSRVSFLYGPRRQVPSVQFGYVTGVFDNEVVDVYDVEHRSIARLMNPGTYSQTSIGVHGEDQMTDEERATLAALRVCRQQALTTFGVSGPHQ
jgi:hypothetical protein